MSFPSLAPINSYHHTPPILTEKSSPTQRFNFPDDYPTTANSTFPNNDFPHLTSPINHSTTGDSPRISGNPLLTKWLPILSGCTPETKDEVISECIAEIVSHTKGSLETLPAQAFSRPKRKPRHQSRDQQRARRARHHDPKDASFIQKLFNIYPKRAVNKVLNDRSPRYDGSLDTLTSFASSFVEPAHFKDSANRIKQKYDECQWTVPDDSQTETLLSPPTRKEILYKLRRVSNTAPGHDKLEYRHLQKCDPSGRLLEALFRVVHEMGVPSSWKKGKTILIHKKGPTNDPGNFRPITLLCTLYKLYSSILAKKIVSVAVDLEWISEEQKGFLPGINGIQEHTYLLESCIGEARKSKRQLYIAWLDLRNAFGSLPHTTLKNLFLSLPIPQRLKAILTELYNDNCSSLQGGEHSLNIHSTAGVRQGDGLSPIIFNLATEPLTRLIKRINPGFNLGGAPVKVATYADDTAIIAGSADAFQHTLNRLTDISSLLGLTFNPTKCASLTLLSGKIAAKSFTLYNNIIPKLAKTDYETYLGIPIGYNYLYSLCTDVPGKIDKLAECLLAPWQKLEVLRAFLLPSISFDLSSGRVSKEGLTKLDQKVVSFLKYICKLPERASNSFLYATRSVGGLAIPKSIEEADVWTLSKGLHLLNSRDKTISMLAQKELTQTIETGLKGATASHHKFLSGNNDGGLYAFRHNSTLTNIWTRTRKAAARLHCKIDADDKNKTLLIIDDFSCRPSKVVRTVRLALRERWSEKLLSLAVQGRVASAMSLDKSSGDIPHLTSARTPLSFTAWSFWSKAKLGCLPTKFIPGVASSDTMCRRCFQKEETTSHVVSSCSSMLLHYTKRHDAVEHILTNLLEILDVPHSLKVRSGALIPDITITSPHIVIDVTCPFDEVSNLASASDRKKSKYADIGTVMPLVVGALGSWVPENDNIKRALNIPTDMWKKMKRKMRVAAIEGSAGTTQFFFSSPEWGPPHPYSYSSFIFIILLSLFYLTIFIPTILHFYLYLGF